MIPIPREYTLQQFFTYGIEPEFSRANGTYRCGCPICREGKSLGRKKRCYYIPEKELITCHNCGWSSRPRRWIQKVTGYDDVQLTNDIKSLVYDVDQIKWKDADEQEEKDTGCYLPRDSIDLLDSRDIEFYSDDKIVQIALKYIKSRRLDTAKFRPDSLYISHDFKSPHANRVIIPFYDADGTLTFYQSRKLLDKDKRPKFLSEGDRSLFNIDKLNPKVGTAYICEGPIEAFFVENGLAVGGITEKGSFMFTQKQQIQWNMLFNTYKRVWVLDSQWLDDAALSKSQMLVDKGEHVFIWPEKVGRLFKDLNDVAIAKKIDVIPTKWIDDNTFFGLPAQIRLANISKNHKYE